MSPTLVYIMRQQNVEIRRPHRQQPCSNPSTRPPGTQTICIPQFSRFSPLFSFHIRSRVYIPIMVGRYTLVGCCIAALSAMTYAQDDVQLPPTIWDRMDLPFTFTDCAAPTEMETCWKAQNFTVEDDLDIQSLGLQNRIDCALTNCWNRV